MSWIANRDEEIPLYVVIGVRGFKLTYIESKKCLFMLCIFHGEKNHNTEPRPLVVHLLRKTDIFKLCRKDLYCSGISKQRELD